MTRFEQVEKFILAKLEKDLPASLYYHGLHHTKDVLNMVTIISETENIDEKDLELLKVSALFHDAGFMLHYKNHEEAGCELATELLPQYGFHKSEIKIICGIIMATKIPQTPHNLLEEIICDADLDYLGRADFEQIAASLFEELKVHVHLNDETQWNKIQVNFIGNHRYFRPFGKEKREPLKQIHLAKIKEWLEKNP